LRGGFLKENKALFALFFEGGGEIKPLLLYFFGASKKFSRNKGFIFVFEPPSKKSWSNKGFKTLLEIPPSKSFGATRALKLF